MKKKILPFISSINLKLFLIFASISNGLKSSWLFGLKFWDLLFIQEEIYSDMQTVYWHFKNILIFGSRSNIFLYTGYVYKYLRNTCSFVSFQNHCHLHWDFVNHQKNWTDWLENKPFNELAPQFVGKLWIIYDSMIDPIEFKNIPKYSPLISGQS